MNTPKYLDEYELCTACLVTENDLTIYEEAVNRDEGLKSELKPHE